MADDTRSYAVPTETIPSLDLSHHLHDLTEIRTFFESLGIETRNTRIERYGNYLERLLSDGAESVDAEKMFKNSAGGPFRSPVDWLLYVLREVHELMWILKGLKAHLPVGAAEKLRLIAGGRDFAALDVDSRSRNIQFELRIASYFCQSGCEVDISTDTDVIARTDRYVFFVECKRVGSKNKLGTRLSEAKGQLARRTPHKGRKQRPLGCIAVDVTRIAFAHNGLTWGVTNEHSREVIQDKLVEIAAETEHLISFKSCPNLLCYWLQIHIPALIMQPLPAAVTTRFSSYHIRRPSLGRKDARTLAAFYRMLESVSTRDARTSPGRALTPRNTVSFPAGTTFDLDDGRIMKLLDQETVSEYEQAEVIGTLTFDGIEDKFTFFEVRFLPGDLIAEWRCEMSDDRAMGSLMLLASLYQRRYPYDESERIAHPGSLAVPTGRRGGTEE
jgi:hypothetical protein